MAELSPLASLGPLGSYIGGGAIPADVTSEELKRRRAVAAALAAQKQKFPTTLGEGMTYLGEAVGQRLADERLSAAEKAQLVRGATARANPAYSAAPAGAVVAPALPGSAPAAAPAAPTFNGRPYTEVPVRKSEGEDDSSTLKDKLAALLLENGAGVPQANPTEGAEAPPLSADMQAVGGQPDPVVLARRNAIGGIESGGRGDPYQALGAQTRSGDRAYGKYQVMGNNIPQWTEAALGQRMTPEQFLASKEAQDKVFDHRFGQYADKYGDEGAARAWYGGERGMKNLGATDVHGRLTVGGYGQDYMNRLQGQRGASAQPNGGAQLASLGGAGGTMTDAPPPGAFASPRDDDQEPTPTDIKPMPVRTAQVGAPPAGVLPGSNASMFDTKPTFAPVPAADPRGTSVPPPTAAPDPGPPPQQPTPTKTMHYLRAVATDPRLDDATKADAAARYAAHEKQQHEIYTQQYGLWKDTFEKRRDYLLTGQFDQRIKELQIRQSLAKDPLEIQKLGGEIEAQKIAREKAAYDITQRPVEEAQKQTTLDQAKRTLAKPDEHVINGTIYQRVPGSDTYKTAPGSPTDDKLTETQARGFKALQRATVAQSLIGNGDVLRGLKDTVAGKVPIGGNYFLSEEYQSKYSAMMTWATAVLRDESGAVLSPSEISGKLKTYFPIPGDSDRIVAEKAARRQAEEQSLYHSLGDKKKLVDDWREQRKSQKTDKPDGTAETSNRGRTRRVIGGHWVYPDEW